MSTRISEKNKYFLLLRETEIIIKKNLETIKRFNNIENTAYISNMIDKLTIQNKEKEKYVSELKIKIDKLSNGEFDNEIIKDNEENKKIIDTKSKEKIDKKKIQLDNVKSQKDVLQKYFKSEKKYDKYDKNDMDRSYNYFLRSVESIPNYMLKNLDNMPNNKGYIWKSIHLYGLLEPDHDKKIILTEKLRNNVTRIHEWNDYEYIIYTRNKNHKDILFRKDRIKLI